MRYLISGFISIGNPPIRTIPDGIKPIKNRPEFSRIADEFHTVINSAIAENCWNAFLAGFYVFLKY